MLEDWPDGLEERPRRLEARCAQGKSIREEGATLEERLAAARLEATAVTGVFQDIAEGKGMTPWE